MLQFFICFSSRHYCLHQGNSLSPRSCCSSELCQEDQMQNMIHIPHPLLGFCRNKANFNINSINHVYLFSLKTKHTYTSKLRILWYNVLQDPQWNWPQKALAALSSLPQNLLMSLLDQDKQPSLWFPCERAVNMAADKFEKSKCTCSNSMNKYMSRKG